MGKISQQLKHLEVEEKALTKKYVELLKETMITKKFNELLVVPINADGDLLMDVDYLHCGEWEFDFDDLRCYDDEKIITRFGIIDSELKVHTAQQEFDDIYGHYTDFNTENPKSLWKPVDRIKNKALLRTLIRTVLTDRFPWVFTAKYPGSRFLPFEFNLAEYIKYRAEDSILLFAFAGIQKVTKLDLRALGSVKRTENSYMFYKCQNVKVIDLSGFASEDDYADGMFDECTSLETIYLRGCDQRTIDIVRKNLESAELPHEVTIITD